MSERGRYQVYVRGGSAAPGQASTGGGDGLPRVKSVTNKGIRFSSGSETFAAMRSARGGDGASVPVSMTMKQARAANARGMLGGRAMNTGADRLVLPPSMIFITVDFTDMYRLGDSFTRMGTVIKRGHAVIAKAINEGIRRFESGVQRDLVQWTGIKSRARVGRGFTRTFASAATLTGRVRVRDRHIRITSEYFGAAWSRSNPGGTHSAWNRPQLAKGSFMIPGAAPLFKRTSRRRFPIEPLWGPNVVREIERHEGQVMARLAAVNVGVQQTAVRLMRMAISSGR